MFKEFITSIASHYSKQLPFVAYRMPMQQEVVALLQENDSLHVISDFEESGFIFAPFEDQDAMVLLRGDRRMTATWHDEGSPTSKSRSIDENESAKNAYIDLVKRAIDEIRRGELQKVVLSRSVEVHCTASPMALFKQLLERYSNAFCYLWYHPKVGLWLGATPEILLKSENRQLTTMSLAGTQKYKTQVPVSWGDKELDEQQLVTSYITDALSDKVTRLSVSGRETIRAGNLLHLRTKLTATYEKGKLGEIVKALHPTPAVCGMPMAQSKSFILGNEGYDRSFYTGYLGELNKRIERPPSGRSKNQENKAFTRQLERTTLFVNLRCMQLKGSKARVYVGGGVTKDSDPYLEWQETVDKTHTMMQVIGSD